MKNKLTLIKDMADAGVDEHIMEPTQELIVENNDLKQRLEKIYIYLSNIKDEVEDITSRNRDTTKWADLDISFNKIKDNANFALETE